MHLWTGLFNLFCVFQLSLALQFRYIYTIFETRKTWNEAKQICEDQFGQLVKIRNISDNDKVVYELDYLDRMEWNNTISHIDGFWNGLSKANINDTTWVYQDCEQYGDVDLLKTAPQSTITQCSISDSSYILHEVECTERHQFVCQRQIGSCWYEPFDGWKVNITNTDNILTPDRADCAHRCNDHLNSTHDCWAFQFFPDIAGGLCILEYNTLSAFFLEEKNRRPLGPSDPMSVLYVRRCFEGVIDKEAYNDYVDDDSTPNSDCVNKTYTEESTAQQVCFCPTEDQPLIPEPISTEEKVEELIKELSIDASNTSSSVRKLTSAEDNRASAIGVGFVGVGLLTGVFGALVLFDVGRFIRGVKTLFQSSEDPSAVKS